VNRPDSDTQGCNQFEPLAPMVMTCYSDGHYMCAACKRFVGREEQELFIYSNLGLRIYTIRLRGDAA
jgi:hypothetical protein